MEKFSQETTNVIQGLDVWYEKRIKLYYTPEVQEQTLRLFVESLWRAEQLSPSPRSELEALLLTTGYLGDPGWFGRTYVHFGRQYIDLLVSREITDLPEEQLEVYTRPLFDAVDPLMKFFSGALEVAERSKRSPTEEEINRIFVETFKDHHGFTEANIRYFKAMAHTLELALRRWGEDKDLREFNLRIRVFNALQDTLPYYNEKLFGDLKAT